VEEERGIYVLNLEIAMVGSSRQQQEAAGSSRKQQEAAGSSRQQ
jgi:hypothetical protein